MKKVFKYLVISLFLTSSSFNLSFAEGKIELIDFKDSYNMVAGQEFKEYISFFYSGSEYKPKVTLVGKTFPTGVSLGQVNYEGSSLYNVLYSGSPTEPGDYQLTLTLTDNYGALITKKINVKVSGLVFSNESLPNAVVGKEYTRNINYSYGGKTALIKFENLPEDIRMEIPNINAYDGSFVLKLTARKPGVYSFTANAVYSDSSYRSFNIGSKVFNLVVNDKDYPQKTEVVNVPVPKVEEIPVKVDAKVQVKVPVVNPTIESYSKTKKETTLIATSSVIAPEPEVFTQEVILEEPPKVVVKKQTWYQILISWFTKK